MLKKTLMCLAAAGVLAILAIPAITEDFSSVNGAPKWKVYDYNRSGQAFSSRIPTLVSDGITFNFLPTPDTALLVTNHPSYRGSLLGNINGKTITATISATISQGAMFTYFGEGTPSNACGTPANVRLYFETSGQFAPTNFWWSDTAFADLTTLAGSHANMTLTASVNPATWSDFNGVSGATDPAAFAAAASNVTFMGLSFGGGCFFENGVGVSGGTGSFKLKSIDVH